LVLVWDRASNQGAVGDLKMAVQRSLGRPFLRLAAADGRILNPTESLQSAGVENGSCIAAIAQQPKIAATQSAFHSLAHDV